MIYREEKQPQIPVNHCAWCGSYDLGIGWQQNEAIVTFRRNGLLGNRLKYVFCTSMWRSRGGFLRRNRGL